MMLVIAAFFASLIGAAVGSYFAPWANSILERVHRPGVNHKLLSGLRIVALRHVSLLEASPAFEAKGQAERVRNLIKGIDAELKFEE